MCYEIKIKIHEEVELYNPFDPEGSELSDEVIAYIVRKYQNSFLDYARKEEMILGKVRNRTTLKQLTMFVIGILAISLWLFVARRTENLLVEILSIIGSFALWEAVNIWIVEKPVMRMEENRLKKMMQAEV